MQDDLNRHCDRMIEWMATTAANCLPSDARRWLAILFYLFRRTTTIQVSTAVEIQFRSLQCYNSSGHLLLLHVIFYRLVRPNLDIIALPARRSRDPPSSRTRRALCTSLARLPVGGLVARL